MATSTPQSRADRGPEPGGGRLAADRAFNLAPGEIAAAADPHLFTGRAPQQVEEFLAEVVEPVLAGSDGGAEDTMEIRV